MNTILDYSKINPESIVFSEPKKVKGGSYMTEINYRTEEGEDVPFIIQTPRLISSEGIVRNDSRAHLELEFDKSHWAFYEFITNIDDHNIVIIEKHSEKWFTNKFPIDVVEEFYKTPVKLGRGKNPPKLKIKIPVNRGEIACNIFDNVKNHISYNEVKKNNKVVCVMQLVGLRFLKQQVICEWLPLQIKVCKESVSAKAEYMINDTYLSDYEENEPEAPLVEEQKGEDLAVELPNESATESITQESDILIQEESNLTEEHSPEVQEESTNVETIEVSESGEHSESSEPSESSELLEESNTVEPEDKNLHTPDLTENVESNYQESDSENRKLINNEDDLDLEPIDLSSIQNLDREDQEALLKSEIDSLNLELSEKNNLIESLKKLLIN